MVRLTSLTPLRQASLAFAVLSVATLAVTAPVSVLAQADDPVRHHALSLVGKPQYGPSFEHFKWVNPDAPKGGRVRQFQEGAFDSLNAFSITGDSATGLTLIYDSLMATSLDEPSTEYCLICEWVSYPQDYASVTFKLRDTARFHDGRPITPEDVIFSLEAQKDANPQFAFYYKNVTRGEVTGERQVTFYFDVKGNRELPQIMGQLNILPKHYWQGKDADGNPRDLSKTTLEVPLGSGPYRIKEFDAGRSITYERVADWWANDLPVARGQWNFAEIQFEYFRERTAAFENFKSGGLDFWRENTAKAWATAYDFGAVNEGRVKLQKIPTERVAPMQAFGFNLRRAQFRDVRVRKALTLAFNFEAINETLLYSQYFRTNSYFDNSELAATGLPKGRELEILRAFEDELPPELFTEAFSLPEGGSQRQHRVNLQMAYRLLQKAGYKREGRYLVDSDGNPLKFEVLLGSPTFKRHTQRYLDDLRRLGVDASIRIVDSAQYVRRRQAFDYDVTTVGFGQSLSPGNEQRYFWGSGSADREGSRNAMGIKNPVVDKIIDKIIFATDRDELVQATRALDRVLLWNHYVVPLWHYPFERYAYWDKFAHPDTLPKLDPGFLRVWWVDRQKEKALDARR